MVTDDQVVRKHLLALLKGGGAHIDFDHAVAKMPKNRQGQKPAGLPYTPWQQLEHMRIAQWDILEYVRNPKHVSPPWPQGYWPDPIPPSPNAWEESIRGFKRDCEALQRLVANPATSLFAELPHGKQGHTVLREILVVADHTAYHLGQLIVLRRLLGSWTD